MDIIRHDHPNIYAGGPNYSRSVRAGNLLFVSGCTANMSTTRIVEAEGGKVSDIVKLTTFVTNKADWFPIEDDQVGIYDEFFRGENPANTIVEAGIGGEGLDIEMDAIAVLD